ncbi:thiolase family protein [Rhodococcus qingshengii]|uniref:thiolase family protein n=1 Tax=Rhodococcus qingshengii TaxID=334542 RepID=UPI0010A6210F|nr:thiolase family protein [Rhodococcus qingshengii]THJ67681.1 thiolase family protein [Rhodococcus qingshengii]
MTSAVIVDAIRSPMAKGKAEKNGKPGGALSSVHPVELLAQVFRSLIDRSGLDSAIVDDVIAGCVSQVGEQSGGVGRFAWLAGGLAETVPGVTINRACGSSQQAADFAAQGIIAGAYDIVVAGGVESMSRVPMFASRIGQDPFGALVNERYAPGLVQQGISADLIASRWKLTRRELDDYAAQSHQRATDADFSREIVSIVTDRTNGKTVSVDETIRPTTTAQKLSELKPSFYDDAMAQRFPEIDWTITAGNSSQLADGAAAVLIMSEERANALGLRARARFHSFAVAADDPIAMLTGPIPATEKLLARSGITIDDIDHFEVNEAFAPVPLAWSKHFGVDPKKVNPRGGAIALGHPLGGSGARLLTTMLHALEDNGGRYGLQTMCEAGGMANATLIERL